MPRSTRQSTALEVRSLRRQDWPLIERLFGQRGACGGCWCMWWRLPRGGKLWDENKGEPNRRAFERLVKADQVRGCLAFSDGEPVGWCCLGPHEEFPRIARVRALPQTAAPGTWAVVCFFIPAGWRKKGVAAALLSAAVDLARKRGARALEGYPVRVRAGTQVPPAFAWTGVPSLFSAAGFHRVSPCTASRPIFRLDLSPV